MHSTVISGRLWVAASAALLGAGCGSDGGSGPGGTPRADLLALARVDSTFAPPPTSVFSVKSNVLRTFEIRHRDPATTLFAVLTFPPRSIAQANGLLVCDTCTVLVSVTLTSGVYGFTVSPSTLVFRSSSTPTIRVSYGQYGDLSVYDSSARYGTESEFEQALELWFERDPGEWTASRNSSHPASMTLQSAIDAPGPHVVAALK
ncbi:MAG: hypothetical protein ACREMV_07250 [Gemmatimonadales bacterium]